MEEKEQLEQIEGGEVNTELPPPFGITFNESTVLGLKEEEGETIVFYCY